MVVKDEKQTPKTLLSLLPVTCMVISRKFNKLAGLFLFDFILFFLTFSELQNQKFW